MKPFPTDLPQTINPEAGPARSGVESHRNLSCPHYDRCLDEAVHHGWQSFSCARCALAQVAGAAHLGIEAYANQRRAL